MRLPSCSVDDLRARAGRPFPPTIVDARRREAFERDPVRLPMALRCEPGALAQQAAGFEPWRSVVVYCVHGHEVSQQAAATLRDCGLDAQFLEGGLDGWRDGGGAVEPWRAPSQWVTRERPKIDRIACPWLVRRFVDASARFHYVKPADVVAFAKARDAIAFDVPDVEYSHDGERCSFDAFVDRHAGGNAALRKLADIVRAADTDTLDRAAQAPGLLAVSLGLGRGLDDDAALLKYGLLVYDALYAWCCREAHSEPGGRDGAAQRAAATALRG